jgi:hypothetical protein
MARACRARTRGTVSDAWICRELREADTDHLRRLIESRDRDARLHLREVDAPGLWWYGAVGRSSAELGAVLQVEGTTATLIEVDPGATEALARGLLQHQRMIGKDHGDRHVLRGQAAAMGRFWAIFQHNGRKVVSDRTAVLHVAPAPGTSRLDVRVGDAGDLKLVSEFLADATLETRGFDPRRTARETHDRRCAQVLRDGLCVVVRDAGAAVLVGELAPSGTQVTLLEPWFVPRAFRARKRLIAQALAPLTGLAPLLGRELLAFADGPELNEAMALAGWQPRSTFRTVEMQG